MISFAIYCTFWVTNFEIIIINNINISSHALGSIRLIKSVIYHK